MWIKLRSIHILMVVSAFLSTNHFVFGQCKAKELVKKSKSNLNKPYHYDSYALNELQFDDKEKKIEVVFTAFQGQKYRILFLTSGFEEDLKVDIYDKSSRVKKGRKKVYDSGMGIDNNFWSFQPPKSGNYYIEYSVPKSLDGKIKKACVVMLIGFVGDKEKTD